ncbi:MAG: hypothetical protein GX895_12190 [Clostridiales bacterium]|uniref:hypothetical protein n=1 Tax=Clostridium sp. N3C TaxID=1776758 RepID=UPI00092DF111|nr:hypothetical protein [Clostridium sp. N3C]NLZ49512.1 hypothetical protein [Clostridiales bacterium]SCN24735.1 hypothetical protein N3C_1953 [Clostridium sp. N3C]
MKKLVLLIVLMTFLMACGCGTETPTSSPNSKSPQHSINGDQGSNKEQVINEKQEINISEQNVHSFKDAYPIGVLPKNEKVFLQITEDTDNKILITDANGEKVIKEIPATKNKDIYSAAVTDKWIVYAEASNDLIKWDWAIYAIDTESEKKVQVDMWKLDESSTAFDVPTMIGPKISASNQQVAWSTFEADSKNAVKAIVKMYDLKNNSYKIIDEIDAKEGEFGHPSISGEWIVYDKGKIDTEKQGRFGSIFLVNTKDNSKKMLEEGMNVVAPAINYPYIVWGSGRSTIKIYDDKKQTTKIVVQNNGTEYWNFTINDKYVAWYSTKDSLDVYSIKENKIISLIDTGVTNGGKLSNNLLWWYKLGEGTTQWLELDLE